MASPKRERQRANRELGLKEQEVVEEKTEQRSNVLKFVAIGAVIVIALLIWALIGRGGDDDNAVTLTAGDQATSEDLVAWNQNAGDLDPEQRNQIYAQVGESPLVLDTDKTYEAVITTDNGEMRFALYDDEAPTTVNNFVNLVNDGFYDGLTFHRVIDGFMAQGGDPSGLGTGGPGYQFINEYTPGIDFVGRGELAMANAGLNTNGSQFFITFGPTGLPADQYTIFGQLEDGDDALGAISMRDPGSATTPGDLIRSVRIEVSE